MCDARAAARRFSLGGAGSDRMPAAQSGVWRDALASALTTCLQPGWASSFMVGRRYMRRGSLFRNNAAAKVGRSPFVGAMVKIPFSSPPGRVGGHQSLPAPR